jgi:hypothetical protein
MTNLEVEKLWTPNDPAPDLRSRLLKEEMERTADMVGWSN